MRTKVWCASAAELTVHPSQQNVPATGLPAAACSALA